MNFQHRFLRFVGRCDKAYDEMVHCFHLEVGLFVKKFKTVTESRNYPLRLQSGALLSRAFFILQNSSIGLIFISKTIKRLYLHSTCSNVDTHITIVFFLSKHCL